jgi:hypothetical protein
LVGRVVGVAECAHAALRRQETSCHVIGAR